MEHLFGCAVVLAAALIIMGAMGVVAWGILDGTD